MAQTPPPLEYTGHLLRRLQQVHIAAWIRDVSTEVTSVQFAALAVLDRNPGASQAELGAELDLDRSTIADLVRRMAARRLLTRTKDDSDHRRNLLRLTPLGRETLAELQPKVQDLEPVLTGGLTAEERRELRRMLLVVLAAAGEQGLLTGESELPGVPVPRSEQVR